MSSTCTLTNMIIDSMQREFADVIISSCLNFVVGLYSVLVYYRL